MSVNSMVQCCGYRTIHQVGLQSQDDLLFSKIKMARTLSILN